ncbi:hypothetical protein Tco_0875556, partial [Tanacetum coccineum]
IALPPRDQRHQYLRYKGLQYTDADIMDFETILARIYRREVDAQGLSLFTSRAWRRLFDIKGPLVHELIMEFFSTFRFGEVVLDLDTPGALRGDGDCWIRCILGQEYETNPRQGGSERLLDRDLIYWRFPWYSPSYTSIRDLVLRLYHRLIAYSIAGRIQAPEKVAVTGLFYLRGMDVGSVNVPYLLARYLRLFVAGRKSGALIYGGQFVGRLAEHFGLLTEERLRGLTIIAPTITTQEFSSNTKPIFLLSQLTMSSPNRSTSDIEDAFSSMNILNYTSVSPDYFPASAGSRSFNSSKNSTDNMIPPVFSSVGLIHIESRKSPTKSLFDATLVSLGCSGKYHNDIA